MQNILYKRLYYGQFFCIAPLIFILRQYDSLLGTLSIVALGCISSYLAYNAIVLFQLLPNKIYNRKAFYAGIVLAIGAALLDLTVTVWHSPNLAQEGNFIVLILFKMHIPLWCIYFLILLFQLISTVLIIFFWGVFLKTYDDIIARIPYKNLKTTLKWLFGSGNMYGKYWFLNPKVDSYFALSIISVTFIVMPIARVYAVLEWLRIIPISSYLRLPALLAITFSGLIGLICFTHYKVKQKASLALCQYQ